MLEPSGKASLWRQNANPARKTSEYSFPILPEKSPICFSPRTLRGCNYYSCVSGMLHCAQEFTVTKATVSEHIPYIR